MVADPPVDVIHIDQKRLAAQGGQRVAQADRAKVAVDVGQGLVEEVAAAAQQVIDGLPDRGDVRRHMHVDDREQGIAKLSCQPLFTVSRSYRYHYPMRQLSNRHQKPGTATPSLRLSRFRLLHVRR